MNVPPDYSGGVYRHVAECFTPMQRSHHHHAWEINLVTHGRAAYIVDGRRLPIERDGLLWLLPQHRHILLDRSDDFRMWIVVIGQPVIRRLADDPPAQVWNRWLDTDGAVAPPYRLVGEAATHQLSALFKTLVGETLPPAHHAAGLAFAAAQSWAAYLDAPDRPAGSHLHPAVRAAVDWLAEHAHTPLPEGADDLDALAQRCHISRPHLSRLFKQQTGQTLTDFRNRQRANRFTALLGRGGQMNATEAAYAAGFGSYAQAYRVVKQLTGKSPRGLTKPNP
ncbi:MAG: AraC family transcriptional regulator [Planctomycetota bacterium]